MKDFLQVLIRNQHEAALQAVAMCLDAHAGRQDCSNFVGDYWYRAPSSFGVHDRDLPWAAWEVISASSLTPEGLRDLVVQAWTGPEFPEANLTQGKWLKMFRLSGFISDEDEAELPPTRPLTLWRGAIPSRQRGMAWTSDRDRAHWFAHRLDGVSAQERGKVWSSTIEPSLVLARFVRRGESEYVIDPRRVHIDEQLPE